MDKNIYLFITMIFLHLIADYNMQGILAQMKQKQWWIEDCAKKNLSFNKYQHDYIVALLEHSFEWSFIVMLPCLIGNVSSTANIIIAILANTIGHFIIDDLKANKLKINLLQDQLFHLLQIIVTFVVLSF